MSDTHSLCALNTSPSRGEGGRCVQSCGVGGDAAPSSCAREFDGSDAPCAHSCARVAGWWALTEQQLALRQSTGSNAVTWLQGWGEPVRGRDSASLAGPCEERWEPVPGRDALSASEPEPSCQRCGPSNVQRSSSGATLPSGIGCWGVPGRLPPVRGLLPPVRGRPLVGRPHCRL